MEGHASYASSIFTAEYTYPWFATDFRDHWVPSELSECNLGALTVMRVDKRGGNQVTSPR